MAKIKIKKKLPTQAFSGSLIQQTFGEAPYGHGYVLWNIETMEVQSIDIENEHRFIKFEINPNTDYDKLNLVSKHIGKYNKFKVDWNDYAASITNENENKIKKYLYDKYGATDIEIKPNRIYTDIKEGKMLSEVIDINNKEVQQKIIKEYLKDNKYEDDFIQEIINIDNIINDKLQLTNTRNILWNIDKFWLNNFKSYGDDNVIEWSNINGIIQIGGENQQGKTTLIDAICFILYGTTLSTLKSEKNGNNRYINKNRDLNYCDGGAVLDINGEKYVMYRKVEREFKNKGKEIKSVPMILEYYKGSEIVEDNKLTGEKKTSTQKLLDSVLGTFDDFIRMALTNSDNLNSLLSMDRGIFIDSIIKDAGYDIFEKKLSEFKEYKKGLNLDKININLLNFQNEISGIVKELEVKQEYLSNVNLNIDEINKTLKEKNIIKDDLLINLNNIDDTILNIDVDDIKKTIYDYKQSKNQIQIDIEILNEKFSGLPTEFDNEKFEKFNEQYNKYINEKAKRDVELVQLNSLYKQNDEKIKNVDKDINIEKTKYIDFLKNNISGLKIELRETVNEINNNLNIQKNILESEKFTIRNEITNLKQIGLDEKKKISDYQNMINGENPICITCHQPIINKDDEHMTSLILESSKKIEDISKIGKEKMTVYNEKLSKITEIENATEELLKNKKVYYDNKIYEIQNKIDNFDISYIQDRIEEVMKNKRIAEIENNSLSDKIEERKKYLEKISNEIKKIEIVISDLKSKRLLFEKYKNLSLNRDRLVSNMKDIIRNYEDNVKLLNEYTKNEKLITDNIRINKELSIIKIEIDNLNIKVSKLLDEKLSYSNDINLTKKVISDMNEKIEKYNEQEKREEIHNSYIKLMHRTGLPTYLLTKNINILNEELSSLLTNINFTLFFDEDLNLKLQHDGLEGVINCIESSGYERTMSAVILKIVLRTINFRSKCNIIFLDEILNRCVGKSVDRFLELLDTLKSRIDKIVIIEHNNEIFSDLLISIQKDASGISSVELI